MKMTPKVNLPLEQSVSGFTLTELAIVLGIIGTILGAIWGAAANVSKQAKVNKMQSEILTIAQNIRTLYATRTTIGTGNLTSAFIGMNVFPSDMISGSTTVNPWQGNMLATDGGTSGVGGDAGNGVTVSSQTVWACSGGDSLHFGVVVWNVPKYACIKLLMNMDANTTIGSGLSCAFSDGTGVLTLNPAQDETNIQTNCKDGQDLAFGFKLH